MGGAGGAGGSGGASVGVGVSVAVAVGVGVSVITPGVDEGTTVAVRVGVAVAVAVRVGVASAVAVRVGVAVATGVGAAGGRGAALSMLLLSGRIGARSSGVAPRIGVHGPPGPRYTGAIFRPVVVGTPTVKLNSRLVYVVQTLGFVKFPSTVMVSVSPAFRFAGPHVTGFPTGLKSGSAPRLDATPVILNPASKKSVN